MSIAEYPSDVVGAIKAGLEFPIQSDGDYKDAAAERHSNVLDSLDMEGVTVDDIPDASDQPRAFLSWVGEFKELHGAE
jgi:hypothetical protein